MSDNVNYLNSKSVLFREGETASKLIIIKSGEVLCLKSSKERLIPVFLAKAGDIIGESAMLDGAPYTYSAIVLSHSELIYVNNGDFRSVLTKAPQWLSDLTLTMIARFQSTAGLIAENKVLSPHILSEEKFPASLEVEYKKLLSQ